MCYINEASYSAACMLIVSEIIKIRDDIYYALYKSIKLTASNNNNAITSIDDDEEERFVDIDR